MDSMRTEQLAEFQELLDGLAVLRRELEGLREAAARCRTRLRFWNDTDCKVQLQDFAVLEPLLEQEIKGINLAISELAQSLGSEAFVR